MAMDDMHTGTTGSAGNAYGATPGRLGRLNDLDDYKVADGYPDPRGWDVKTADGQKVGKVDDLIVDTEAMRVRYVSVEVDRSLTRAAADAVAPGDRGAAEGTHTLLPVGSVELDDAHDDVLVGGYSAEQVAGLPRYRGGAGGTITRDYESSLVDRHRNRGGNVASGMGTALAGAGAAVAAGAERVKDAVTGERRHDYDHEDYDDQRLYARRRGTANSGGEQRLTLAEERLEVGKREVAGGEVELRKAVDTEPVRQQVQLRHDEVSVERRPITDPSQITGQPQIGEDEIRIPVMEEQVVVQKVLVPREEIIVRKRAVTEEQTVEDTVRRERLVVDDSAAATRGLVRDSANPDTRGDR